MSKKKKVRTSVSQVNNFENCNRKWYYTSIDYLGSVPRKSTAKGDRFHFVLENYLDVDENHLKDGSEPEIFPENWHIQKDFWGKEVLFVLDDSEQQVIRKALSRGIADGILVRHPESETEFKLDCDINEDIAFWGSIDYCYDFTIEDHKSCKDF